MRHLLTETRPGETVELTVMRDGRETAVTVPLGKRPPADDRDQASIRIPIR